MAGAGDEHERIAQVYAGYRVDSRKLRAWQPDNRGNTEIRAELARAVLELLPAALADPGLLLDAGCGGGWWLARLLAAGAPAARVAGVELLAERVAAARRRAPGAAVQRADLRRLPFEDDSCSLVTMFTVLSSMGSAADRRSALLEARRVLEPRGVLVVWEPRWPTRNPHTQLVRLAELRDALGVAAMLQVNTLTLAPPLARRAGRLYRPLARVPALRSHRLVVLRSAS